MDAGPGTSTEPVDPPVVLGDVVVCPTVAARQAPEHACTLDDELALLVVHGVLHLLDYDHAESKRRRRCNGANASCWSVSASSKAEGEVTVSGADWAILVVVIVLFVLSILLALARRPRSPA